VLSPTPNPSQSSTSPRRIKTFRITARTTRRRLGVLAAATVVALLLVALAAAPAGAHGGLENPVSRQVACGPEGGQGSQSEACVAAIAATGGQRLEDWDNIRLPNVGGNDQAAVPDGQLCSAGLDEFSGLDAPRTDWPSTTLSSGISHTFRYRATVPHEGQFRLYVTEDGYDPTEPLGWSDLEPEPFLTATDPPLAGGAYTMEGQLPTDKAGPHLIYTVWQNSDSPDTYYSCSDVVFAGASTADGTGTETGADTGTDAETSADTGASQDAAAAPDPQASAEAAAPAEPAASQGNPAFPWILGTTAVIVLVMLVSFALRRSRW
jgi:predicted carbohydrate-binding protein with CBM5 and CBM33 domain